MHVLAAGKDDIHAWSIDLRLLAHAVIESRAAP
jgi:hypothetical protein